jgi:pyridoxamine 5'-phosphate oxidase
MNSSFTFGRDIAADAPVADPLDLLDSWLERVDRTGCDPAAGAEGGGGTMALTALATVDTGGAPRVRHVLLSSYDRGRLHFHTDTRSEKAAELAANPRAAATLVWPDAVRQLSVTGTMVKEQEAERRSAYARRSRHLQLLAWLNESDLAQRPEAERKRAWAQFDAAHPTLEPPPTWIGYALVAERIVFWRGADDGPSQRISCQRTGPSWAVERLPG